MSYSYINTYVGMTLILYNKSLSGMTRMKLSAASCGVSSNLKKTLAVIARSVTTKLSTGSTTMTGNLNTRFLAASSPDSSLRSELRLRTGFGMTERENSSRSLQ